MAATVDRIAAELGGDRFVYRFRTDGTDGPGNPPLGAFEGAFLPCTFWLATVRAMAGRREEAEAILAAAEDIAGELGLFAEEVDIAARSFLGNTPLLFAHAEYLRAVMALAADGSRPRART